MSIVVIALITYENVLWHYRANSNDLTLAFIFANISLNNMTVNMNTRLNVT